MSLGVHRAVEARFVTAAGARAGRGPCSISPAARATSASPGSASAAGRRSSRTSTRRCSAVGRDRAIARGLVGRLWFCWSPTPRRCRCRMRGLDRVAIAFGLRNCTDKAAVLREARRVLRPGGRFLCLEFSRVQVAALAPALRCVVLPRAAAARRAPSPATRESYQYLAESIRTFPDAGGAGRDDACGRASNGSPSSASRAALPRSTRAGGCDRLAEHGACCWSIAGGIAAYKALELDPPAAQARRRRDLRADRERRAVRDAAVAPGAQREPRLYRPVLAHRRERDGAYPASAAAPTSWWWRRPPPTCSPHGGRHRRRSRDHAAARHRQAGAGGAGDERAHVAASGDGREHGDAGGARGGLRRARTRARWRATSSAPAASPSRPRSWPRSRRCSSASQTAGRPARAGDQRADARADRPGPLHRQPLQRPAGPRDRGGAGRPRRAGDAGGRAGRRCPTRPASRCGTWRPRPRCWRPARRRCRPTSRCSPPPSPTGGSPRERGHKIKKAPGGRPRRCRWSRTPTSWRPSPRPARAARAWWSVSPPRPTIWWRTPRAKRVRKGCDWIVANDVRPETGIMGGDDEHRPPGHGGRRGGLAGAAEGGGGGTAGGPDRGGAGLTRV